MSAFEWYPVTAEDHEGLAAEHQSDAEDFANLAAAIHGRWAFDERSRIAAEVIMEWAEYEYALAAIHRDQAETRRQGAES
jgi:hypothetical protein